MFNPHSGRPEVPAQRKIKTEFHEIILHDLNN